VFLTGQNPNPWNREEIVSPVPPSSKQSQVKLILNVKNSSCQPLSQTQLQKIIENYVKTKTIISPQVLISETKKQIVKKEESYQEELTKKNSKVFKNIYNNKSLEESKSYSQFVESLSQLKQSSLEKTLEEAILSTKVIADMESQYTMDQSKSASIDFDQLLYDICNDVQSNDEAIIEDVLEELTGTSSNESVTFDILKDDFDLPDLAELPLEDLSNLESLLTTQGDYVEEENFNLFDINQIVASPLSSSSSSSDLEDILSDIGSSNDEQDNHNIQFNNLVDTILDSDFMQEFLASSEINTALPQVSLPDISTTDISSIEVGCKRKLTDTLSDDCPSNKYVKHNEQIVPLAMKENETEKEAVRRIKNNEASKITRAKRKQKQEDLFKQESELLQSNAQLKIKIEVMQKEAEILRKVLVSKLSSVKN